MTKDHTHLFEANSKKYAFDSERLVAVSLDDITYDLLTDLKNGQVNSSEYCKYEKALVEESNRSLQEVIKEGFFFGEDEDEMVDNRVYQKAYFSFPTVHRCNFKCRYCFADAGRNFEQYGMAFQPETLRKAMEYLYMDLFADIETFRLDFVSGGEPLLNFGIIQDCVQIGRDLYNETGKKLEIWLCTNGSINQKSYWEFLEKNRISLGVSIDGDQSEHDKNRLDNNGNGTYQLVTKNIRYIIDNPDFNSNFRDLWGLSVITGDTSSLVDILKHNKELGFNRMQMKFVRLHKDVPFSINRQTIIHVKEMYHDLAEFLKSTYDTGDLSYLNMIVNENDYFGKILCRLILREKYHTRCFAGKCKVSITANGQLYPCDSFVGNSDYCLGDIYRGIDAEKREKFYETTIYTREPCRNCWAKYVCGGDCLHNAYLVNGDIHMCDETFCDFMHYAIELGIDLIQHISEGPYAQNFYRFLKLRSFM